jgi:diguanylate cyclase (GGDEF)-like protein
MRGENASKTNLSFTGLPQRWEFQDYLESLILDSQASGKTFTFVFIQLDKTKKKTSSLRNIGIDEEMIKYAASTLKLSLGGSKCHLFHYGNDEFMAVFPEKDPAAVVKFIHQINHNLLRRPFLFNNKLHKVKVKMGVACFPQDGWKREELIQKASSLSGKLNTRKYVFWTISKDVKNKRLKPILIGLFCFVAGLTGFYFWEKFDVDRTISSALTNMLIQKLLPEDTDLVRVVTHTGSIFEGFLLAENERGIVLGMQLGKGKGTMSIPKSEIANIIRNESDSSYYTK